MIILSEYDAMQSLVQGLKMAQAGAREMARYQPDKGAQWMKMAEVYGVSIEGIYRLTAEAASRTKDLS